MAKDFDGWNETKKHIHDRGAGPFYHERDVWWCTLGVNVGFEQDGSGEEYRRPAIVPLTTSPKHHPLREPIGLIDGKAAQALLSQIRVIDTKRLVRKICRFDAERFSHIQQKTAKALL